MLVKELISILSGLDEEASVYVLGYGYGDEEGFGIPTELRSFFYDGEFLELRGPVLK
jgi:hypothetical protein